MPRDVSLLQERERFWMAIEKMWREGVETIDFLRGNEPFKDHWHAETVPAAGLALQRSEVETGNISRTVA